MISVSAADLDAAASPDRTALRTSFRSDRNVAWALSVLVVVEATMPVAALLDCAFMLPSKLWSESAVVWASVISPDCTDCSKFASVFPREFGRSP